MNNEICQEGGEGMRTQPLPARFQCAWHATIHGGRIGRREWWKRRDAISLASSADACEEYGCSNSARNTPIGLRC